MFKRWLIALPILLLVSSASACEYDGYKGEINHFFDDHKNTEDPNIIRLSITSDLSEGRPNEAGYVEFNILERVLQPRNTTETDYGYFEWAQQPYTLQWTGSFNVAISLKGPGVDMSMVLPFQPSDPSDGVGFFVSESLGLLFILAPIVRVIDIETSTLLVQQEHSVAENPDRRTLYPQYTTQIQIDDQAQVFKRAAFCYPDYIISYNQSGIFPVHGYNAQMSTTYDRRNGLLVTSYGHHDPNTKTSENEYLIRGSNVTSGEKWTYTFSLDDLLVHYFPTPVSYNDDMNFSFILLTLPLISKIYQQKRRKPSS